MTITRKWTGLQRNPTNGRVSNTLRMRGCCIARVQLLTCRVRCVGRSNSNSLRSVHYGTCACSLPLITRRANWSALINSSCTWSWLFSLFLLLLLLLLLSLSSLLLVSSLVLSLLLQILFELSTGVIVEEWVEAVIVEKKSQLMLLFIREWYSGKCVTADRVIRN